MTGGHSVGGVEEWKSFCVFVEAMGRLRAALVVPARLWYLEMSEPVDESSSKTMTGGQGDGRSESEDTQVACL